MSRFDPRTPSLDFIVIGAQKAGTTALWRYLRGHPDLRTPPAKEASFFTEAGYPSELRSYLRALFKDSPRRARRGTVTPVYMLGVPGVSAPEVAARIRATVPDVRLVAILRDPVERAFSAYRMSGSSDPRTFAEAIAEQLEPRELERARRGPEARSSYVVGGEYGRVLAAYLDLFPREQLHVELHDDLERAPGAVVARVCSFLGVAPNEPEPLPERAYPSGRPRVSTEAEAELKTYLERNAWSRMRHAEQHREAFEFWFRLWNAVPAPPAEEIDEATAARLRAHYASDSELLAAVTGVEVPWRDAPTPAAG